MLLEIRDGSACRNGMPVLSHFSFEIRGTEKIAVTGRNGAGKTTLLKVLAGEIELEKNEKNPDSGMTQARAFSLGMLNQQAADQPEKTVEELVRQAVLSGSNVFTIPFMMASALPSRTICTASWQANSGSG